LIHSSHPKTITLDDESSLLPKLKYDHTNTSLEHILQGGKGIISELVAKWIASCGFLPENLLKINSTKSEQTPDTPENHIIIDEHVTVSTSTLPVDSRTESLQTLCS
jgi:hypothetical protein